jgi:hypothetical protein
MLGRGVGPVIASTGNRIVRVGPEGKVHMDVHVAPTAPLPPGAPQPPKPAIAPRSPAAPNDATGSEAKRGISFHTEKIQIDAESKLDAMMKMLQDQRGTLDRTVDRLTKKVEELTKEMESIDRRLSGEKTQK